MVGVGVDDVAGVGQNGIVHEQGKTSDRFRKINMNQVVRSEIYHLDQPPYNMMLEEGSCIKTPATHTKRWTHFRRDANSSIGLQISKEFHQKKSQRRSSREFMMHGAVFDTSQKTRDSLMRDTQQFAAVSPASAALALHPTPPQVPHPSVQHPPEASTPGIPLLHVVPAGAGVVGVDVVSGGMVGAGVGEFGVLKAAT